MPKSLAELRQSPRVGLPERSYQLCVASTLVAEAQSLLEQMQAARSAEAAQREGDESAAPPKRLAEGSKSSKIRARLGELQAELEEHTGALVLRGWTEGAWRLWVDEHPARPDNERDNDLGYGYCNTDALMEELGSFAHSWNGDPLGEGDWAWLVSKAAPGDLKAIVSVVVQMHETVVDLPKLLSSSLETLDAASD